MSDTPETDIECFIYEGDYVPASFARQLERERDEARKEVELMKADKARMERALRQAMDYFWEIENTRWGYDGDCGVVAIANEGSDLIQAVMKGAE